MTSEPILRFDDLEQFDNTKTYTKEFKGEKLGKNDYYTYKNCILPTIDETNTALLENRKVASIKYKKKCVNDNKYDGKCKYKIIDLSSTDNKHPANNKSLDTIKCLKDPKKTLASYTLYEGSRTKYLAWLSNWSVDKRNANCLCVGDTLPCEMGRYAINQSNKEIITGFVKKNNKKSPKADDTNCELVNGDGVYDICELSNTDSSTTKYPNLCGITSVANYTNIKYITLWRLK